ncbi:hypothetical protein ASPWEDRAFT_174218 [Aspergillus wentii DTO 134E9]|uniref:Uncharacterized protein n=1 Tax=Aspergillus wentii DTO 134E9 TaxID=1073089 RepID=A0A1L9RCY8_ASPWE|nr:uncharacterized protein ASPWEDRAFT_174218 [Aspergillus wentii DTO 134E9]KAI9933051.1 hypothetical protein MW887_007522 [Aspergillus wentii]OJJ32774.1 hypothetical protein ASPWEDRAFT_174218 [Aspergillus wentii DTO 134E9]
MPSSSPAGSKPEKTMSSRLLTMKFMQRAAAANAKDSSQAQSTETSNSPTPKRQRLSVGHDSPPAQQSSDLEAISAALAAEEEKRREAVSRQAAEAGESEWVLDYSGFGEQQATQPLVVAAGSLDADDDADMLYSGRQSYGNFKPKKKAQTQTVSKNNDGEEDEDEDEEDEDEDGDEDGGNRNKNTKMDVLAMINKEKKAANKKGKFKPQAERPRLSQLTSLSGTRQGAVGGGGGNKSQKKRKHK